MRKLVTHLICLPVVLSVPIALALLVSDPTRMPDSPLSDEWPEYARERLVSLVPEPEMAETWEEIKIVILDKDDMYLSVNSRLDRISICRGALEILESSSQFDLMLAHEAGHIALKHRSTIRVESASSPSESSGMFGTERRIVVDYELLKKQEMEADRFMVQRVFVPGRNMACEAARLIAWLGADAGWRYGYESDYQEVITERVRALTEQCVKDKSKP